jgi:hypothetical protein
MKVKYSLKVLSWLTRIECMTWLTGNESKLRTGPYNEVHYY